MEVDIFELVGLEVRKRLALALMGSEAGQDVAANSLALKVGLNRHGTRRPMRFEGVALRPLSNPP